jgi:phenylacetate-CoA ligase
MPVFSDVHEALSRRILLPAGRLRRKVHPARRQAESAYAHGLSQRRILQTLGPEERRAWVLDRLRLVVRHAAVEIPYYRELFSRIGFDPTTDFSFDDFARLPVLEREDLRSAGKELISKQIPEQLLFKDATGGSTGAPTEVWLGPEEIGWRDSGLEYSMERIGVPTGVRTAFFWGHNLDPVNRDSLRDRYHDFETNRRWFDCFRLSPEVFESYHRKFQEWKPACIVAYASALGHFAGYLLERGYKPDYPTHCFVTGAEKLLPAHRDAIRKVFKRPVHERYGSRDVGLMGFQYDPERTLDFEVDWLNILVEPETADPPAPILITKLHADGMPLLRYRIGDVGHFPDGSKPGHPAFVLQEIVGRESARLWLPDGRWVLSEEFPHLLKDYPVKEFMCIQQSDYSVQLQIVPRNGFSEENKQRILETMGVNLPGLDMSIVVVDEIPRTAANKWQPVVSHVRQG